MATQRKNIPSMSLTKNEIYKLDNALKNPEFRQMLCDYANEVNNPDARACYEADIKKMEAERGNRCHFFHPKDGYVIKTANLRTDEKAFINVCSDSLVAPHEAKPDGNGRVRLSLPYAVGQPRKDTDKGGRPCAVYDVVYSHGALQEALANPKMKKRVTDSALDAVETNFGVKLGRKDLRFPKLKFKGQFKPTVIRRPLGESDEEEHDPGLPEERPSGRVKGRTPAYTLKYQHNLKDDLPSSGLVGRRTGRVDDPCRPSHVFVEIHLPEMENAKGVDLDLVETGLTLESETPAAYNLSLSFAYPVVEEEAVAKFDKTSRRLTVTVPVQEAKEVQRLVSTDSGIDVDTGYVACTEEDAKEEKVNEAETEEEEGVLPPYNCNIYEDLMIFTLDVARVEESSLVKTFSASGDSLEFSLRFSSVGGGMVRLGYSFCCVLPVTGVEPVWKEPLEVEVWDNNVIVKVTLPGGGECEKYKVGSRANDLTIHMLPQFRALRKKKEKMLKDAPLLTPEASLEDDAFEAASPSLPPSEDSKERHSSGDSDDSLLSCDAQRAEATKAGEGDQHQESIEKEGSECAQVFLSDGRALRSILKYRKQRCFSESQTDLLSWRGSGVSSSCLSSCVEEEEDEGTACSASKKSVRFSATVQRQIFRPNSSIFGLTAKNQKKKDQKRRRAERRASEGDASATENETEKEEEEEEKEKVKAVVEEEHDDSGVASSVDEGGESKAGKKKARRKRGKKQGNKAAAALSDSTNDLIFDLDF